LGKGCTVGERGKHRECEKYGTDGTDVDRKPSDEQVAIMYNSVRHNKGPNKDERVRRIKKE